MKRSLLILWLVSLVSCAAFDNNKPPENPLSDTQLTNALQLALEEGTKVQKAGGATASLYISDGCQWVGTTGNTRPKPGVPIESEMIFGLGSITKTFVAAIILQLVEERRLTLDDNLGKWMKDYPNIDSGITIRQLLNHGSGLYNYTDSDFWDTVDANPDHVWTPSEILTYVKPPPHIGFAPPKYSNTNYILLGMTVEIVTGNSFEHELQQRIIGPLNLNNTRLVTENFQSASWADRTFLANSMYSGFWTAGAIASTAEDIAKWSHVFYSGRLFETATANEIFKTQPIRSQWGAGEETGLGLFKQRIGAFIAWGHEGWAPPFVSSSFYVPELNLSVAYSTIEPDFSQPDFLYQSLVRTYIDNQPNSVSLCVGDS